MLLSSCISNKNNAPAPNVPEGTFAGRFSLYHLHSKTGVVDTLTANLILNMETATGYKVTGDTSTLHAGSYGSYLLNSTYTGIEFIDKTYPATGTPAKNHLNGIYEYVYNGTTLQFEATDPADTLIYFYNFTKTGN